MQSVDNRPRPRLQSIHRALADPLRIHLLELLWERTRSAKELAAAVGMPADRLYHHLARLEEGGLVEIADYRKLPGGKVERLYAPTAVEPPGDGASPTEIAHFLNAVLEATRADVNAASFAKEAGEDRRIGLGRTVLRLNEAHLDDLRGRIEELLVAARDNPDHDGVWTTVLWTMIDRQDRNPSSHASPKQPRRKGEAQSSRTPAP
jgi:DNA-binding transcriptional ArsR family regulator